MISNEEKYLRILSYKDLFWSHVNRGNYEMCWPWLFATNSKGYGITKIMKTHRIAWILTHGMISSEEWVLHRCDNPPCCNPSHLFLGNNDINIADMVSKGRQCKGERASLAVRAGRQSVRERDPDLYIKKFCEHHQGSKHPMAKLSESNVRDIRISDGTLEDIASRFGVSAKTISDIRRRRRWKHIL